MNSLIAINGLIGSGKDTTGRIIQYYTGKEQWNVTLEQFLENYWLSNGYNITYEIKKFAGKIKQIASIILNVPVSEFEKESFKNSVLPSEWDVYVFYNQQGNGYGSRAEIFANEHDLLLKYPDFGTDTELYRKQITVRQFLQWLGTEAGRNSIHPEIWVNSLFVDYRCSYENNPWYDNKSVYEVSEEDELANPPMPPRWIITDLRFRNEYNAIKNRNGVCLKVIRGESTSSHISELDLNGVRFDWTIHNNGTIKDLEKKVLEFMEYFKIR